MVCEIFFQIYDFFWNIKIKAVNLSHKFEAIRNKDYSVVKTSKAANF